jgi:hypothetical protein
MKKISNQASSCYVYWSAGTAGLESALRQLPLGALAVPLTRPH